MYNAAPVMIGFIFTSYAIAQTISTPLVGKFSDRFGRKILLMYSLIGLFIGFCLMGLTLTFKWPIGVFLAFRFLAGLAGSLPPVAKAYIADVVDVDDRPLYFSRIGAIVGGAFALGPALGGGLSTISLAAPLYGASIVALIAFIFTAIFFEDAPKKNKLENKNLDDLEKQEIKVVTMNPLVENTCVHQQTYATGSEVNTPFGHGTVKAFREGESPVYVVALNFGTAYLQPSCVKPPRRKSVNTITIVPIDAHSVNPVKEMFDRKASFDTIMDENPMKEMLAQKSITPMPGYLPPLYFAQFLQGSAFAGFVIR
jgi:MFS family permease